MCKRWVSNPETDLGYGKLTMTSKHDHLQINTWKGWSVSYRALDWHALSSGGSPYLENLGGEKKNTGFTLRIDIWKYWSRLHTFSFNLKAHQWPPLHHHHGHRAGSGLDVNCCKICTPRKPLCRTSYPSCNLFFHRVLEVGTVEITNSLNQHILNILEKKCCRVYSPNTLSPLSRSFSLWRWSKLWLTQVQSVSAISTWCCRSSISWNAQNLC